MRVLVVDDDDIALDLLECTLASDGHDVETAGSGQEALKRLRRGDIRCVITDWDMPGMSGIDLCRFVRRNDTNGYVYIILLTSHDRQEDVVAGLSAGADDFVRKPFDPSELICRIRVAERTLTLETRDLAIFAMAKLAESRDTDTGEHLERVQRYSECLARELSTHPEYGEEIDDAFIRMIFLTSPLHDIGKVGIPDRVLLKPGKLTDDEFAIMKTHAQIGADTLKAALERHPGTSFLRMAHDIAATHHERWDGRGYPRGLAGKDIPLCGRIVAVADVYDALTTKRVYKDAFSHTLACSMMFKDSGSHFDPLVIDAFQTVADEFLAISERFIDTPIVDTVVSNARNLPTVNI